MKRKSYSADVFLNGEWHCSVTTDSRKDALVSANHYAEALRKREATIAKHLKIRDRTYVEIRQHSQTICR